MGNAESSTSSGTPVIPPAVVAGPSDKPSACPVSKAPVESGSKCPFGFGGDSPAAAPTEQATNTTHSSQSSGGCTVKAAPETPGMDGCPVRRKNGGYVNKDQFNVYSQKINPLNNMPTTANQAMAPGQDQPLSVDRTQSQIPKGGTESDTWLYPSPQMFWNAIVRKGKSEDSKEEIKHMETVVAIHNNMNEKTWKQILSWEKLHDEYHHTDGTEPKLLRFIGRPDEMTPKAKLRTLLGQPEPFDRHDWTVDRGGKLVRYVIDYYFDEEAASNDSVPKSMSDVGAVRSIRVDARPALDSPHAVVDQFLYMPMQLLLGKTEYSPPPLFSNINLLNARLPSLPALPAPQISKEDILAQNWAAIQEQCAVAKEQLAQCAASEDPDSCQGAKSIALRRCTATVVCPDIAKAFDDAVRATDQDLDTIDVAFGNMSKCLDDFHDESKEFLSSKNK